MTMESENRGHRPGGAAIGARKAVPLASVVRRQGRGKIEQACRLPSVVASAPHGERHDQDQTTSVKRPLAAINECSIQLPGQFAADDIAAVEPSPEPRSATAA